MLSQKLVLLIRYCSIRCTRFTLRKLFPSFFSGLSIKTPDVYQKMSSHFVSSVLSRFVNRKLQSSIKLFSSASDANIDSSSGGLGLNISAIILFYFTG